MKSGIWKGKEWTFLACHRGTQQLKDYTDPESVFLISKYKSNLKNIDAHANEQPANLLLRK